LGISNQKGDIGEAAFILAVVKKGWWFAKMPQDCPYDMVIDRRDGSGPKRVQVKYRAIEKSGAVSIQLTSTASNRNDYTVESIDYFGIYLQDTEECFLVPICDLPIKGAIYFRCIDAKNKQIEKVRSIYQFEKL